MEKKIFVVNPKAKGGAIEKIWKRFKEREGLKQLNEIHPESTEDLKDLMGAWIGRGVNEVVVVGGDGTINQVLNSLFDEAGTRPSGDLTLSILPIGTGCDFARALKIPKDLISAFKSLEKGEVRPIDIGVIRYKKRDNSDAIRYFINIGGFGANGYVVNRVNRSSKWAGGFLIFLWATMATLLRYRSKKAIIRVDGEEIARYPVHTLFVANGRYCGAGMLVAPEARLDDGLFDIIIVKDMPTMTSILNISKLYNGRILSHPGVEYLRGQVIEALPYEEGEFMVECDGEQPGILPAEFRIIRMAINVRVNVI